MAEMIRRRSFMAGAACAAAAGLARPLRAEGAEDALDVWQRETDLVSSETYKQYRVDGDTRGLASLEKLERGFEKIFREARETKVESTPAVWSVYNMGYIVKTPGALFSIDLVHRRAPELAPFLDFELVTHNHADHFHPGLYQAMDGAGKTVISNFLDNYGVRKWKQDGGYTRAAKTFKIKDVEIRVGDFILYHTGDSGRGTEHKLGTVWGKPDLWLFFPGCGINPGEAVRRVRGGGGTGTSRAGAGRGGRARRVAARDGPREGGRLHAVPPGRRHARPRLARKARTRIREDLPRGARDEG